MEQALTTKEIRRAIQALKSNEINPQEYVMTLVYIGTRVYLELKYPKIFKKARKLNKNIWDKRTKAYQLIKNLTL